jgi:hypothetical protein
LKNNVMVTDIFVFFDTIYCEAKAPQLPPFIKSRKCTYYLQLRLWRKKENLYKSDIYKFRATAKSTITACPYGHLSSCEHARRCHAQIGPSKLRIWDELDQISWHF